MSVDLSQLSIAELSEVARKAEELKAQKRESEKASAREIVSAKAESLGFTIAELFPTATAKPTKKSRGSKSSPKFANPTDPSQTWTGRGKQPNWYKDAIAGGLSPGDLRIAA